VKDLNAGEQKRSRKQKSPFICFSSKLIIIADKYPDQ